MDYYETKVNGILVADTSGNQSSLVVLFPVEKDSESIPVCQNSLEMCHNNLKLPVLIEVYLIKVIRIIVVTYPFAAS